jgi:hypothetical protein
MKTQQFQAELSFNETFGKKVSHMGLPSQQGIEDREW